MTELCSLCGKDSDEISWFNGKTEDIGLCPDCLIEFEPVARRQ